MSTADRSASASRFRLFAAPLTLTFLFAACGTTEGIIPETAPERDTVAVAAPPPPPPPERIARNNARPAAAVDTVRAGRFDDGRMWTFDLPPAEYFREEYGIAADDAWFERARLGALRIPGCSASFVSADGLVLTNHHCARNQITQVTRDGEQLLDEGFLAQSPAEERLVDGMWADQLVDIADVTEEIYDRIDAAQTDAERAEARSSAIQEVSQRMGAQAGPDFHVEVISLYNGARFSAYTFRRYRDVRLVMAPELQLGYFGGDTDNFTYPRYSLDMTFFRVYHRGNPLRTDHFYTWTTTGVEEGDAVFIIGNPGSTNRLETVAQLEYRRDVQERYLLDWINRRVSALESFLEEEPSDEVRNQLFSLLNAQKLYQGRLRGLEDETLMARRRDTERRVRMAIDDDEQLRAEYGDLHERMRALQGERREFAASYGAFFGLTPQSTLGSAVMRRAMVAARIAQQIEEGAGEAATGRLREQLVNIPDQPVGIQQRYLADRLEAFQQYFGVEDEQVVDALAGRSPEAFAQQIIQESALVRADDVRATLEAGELATDPAVRLARVMLPRFAEYESAVAGIGAQEQDIASRLGRVRFEIDGAEVPPDATFSLRIADGVVAGYPYNGTIAPAYTTYYGMYDRHYSHGPDTEWDLPQLWHDQRRALTLSTPLNFVSTNDIIGGNSGSPVLNSDLELVGLVFDGNIEFLPSSFIYTTERGRAVSVDARGMIEALETVYGAEHIVQELRQGSLVSR